MRRRVFASRVPRWRFSAIDVRGGEVTDGELHARDGSRALLRGVGRGEARERVVRGALRAREEQVDLDRQRSAQLPRRVLGAAALDQRAPVDFGPGGVAVLDRPARQLELQPRRSPTTKS